MILMKVKSTKFICLRSPYNYFFMLKRWETDNKNYSTFTVFENTKEISLSWESREPLLNFWNWFSGKTKEDSLFISLFSY